MSRFENNQGVINGRVTALADNTKELAEYMSDKTDKQKEQARNHLITVRKLRKLHG